MAIANTGATALSVAGNVTGGNVLTGGLISATANITGGNVSTAGQVTATGNVTGGNIITSAAVSAGSVSASGTITGGGNITGGNVLTGGLVSGTGNVTGGNLITGGLITATGNITSTANIGAGNVNATSHTGTTVSVTGNVTAGNLNAAGLSLTSNVVSALNVTGNVAGGNITTAGTISGSHTGSGAGLTSIPGGNVTGTVANATLAATATNATNVTGTSGTLGFSTSAVTVGLNNLAGGQIQGTGGGAAVLSLHRPGAYGINMGLDTDNVFRIGGWSDGASTYRFQVAAGGAVTAATFSGVSATAKYADLAEYYAADAEYPPGTVLSFGGDREVTMTTGINDVRVAGVVSTNPAYAMNTALEAEHTVALALTGRVPTLVVGAVAKGDMMVSAGGGRAKACATPVMGSVIGKAVHDHPGGSGMIEIVVGRL